MTKIPNLSAIVSISTLDLMVIEDISEEKTKKMTVGQFLSLLTGGGGGATGYDDVVVSAAGTAIAAPAAGLVKYVELTVAADTTFTGLPAPTNSRKEYVIVQRADYEAFFNRSIDGQDIALPVLSGIGARIRIVDMGTYKLV